MNTDPLAVRLRQIRDAQTRVGAALNTLNKAYDRDQCVHQQEIEELQAAHNALSKLVKAV